MQPWNWQISFVLRDNIRKLLNCITRVNVLFCLLIFLLSSLSLSPLSSPISLNAAIEKYPAYLLRCYYGKVLLYDPSSLPYLISFSPSGPRPIKTI
jgi:hypothetical protein